MSDQNTNDTIGLEGRLLVAAPQLKGGPFERSVILIGIHDSECAFGLILNKPIKGVSAGDAVDMIELEPAITAKDKLIHFGGPVQRQRGFILHTLDFSLDSTILVPGTRMGITSDRRALERLGGDRHHPQYSRLFAGYAGWSSGQLEDELRRETWLDIAATSDLVFGVPPEEMWEIALSRIGVSGPSLWRYGNDPSAGSRPLN